uniref:Uncharacterized protein n=1 Tax=Heterorhabditis bacteriophora TaxID=37862 RepID=A0A1I7XB45_HETBA
MTARNELSCFKQVNNCNHNATTDNHSSWSGLVRSGHCMFIRSPTSKAQCCPPGIGQRYEKVARVVQRVGVNKATQSCTLPAGSMWIPIQQLSGRSHLRRIRQQSISQSSVAISRKKRMTLLDCTNNLTSSYVSFKDVHNQEALIHHPILYQISYKQI